MEIRLPNITGASEKEQLQQIKSFLYQHCEQLQWALNHIDTEGTSSVASTVRYEGNQIVRVPAEDTPSGDAQPSFNEIKSLIIKSAEIADAFYEKVSKKLQGAYVAKSDFGAYMQKTDLEIEATSTAITQKYEFLEAIVDNNKSVMNESLEAISENISDTRAGLAEAKSQWDGELEAAKQATKGLETDIKEIRGYIKSGLVTEEEGGVPEFGIEIGQFSSGDGIKEEKGFVRITAKRMTFFDSNGHKVAYISNQKLYVDQAEINVSYKIGGLEDKVMGTGDVVTKWVGGDW